MEDLGFNLMLSITPYFLFQFERQAPRLSEQKGLKAAGKL
jgi:hypothetical protein